MNGLLEQVTELKDLAFNVRAAGRQRKISSDLDLKFDFSLEVIRLLLEK